MHIDISKRKLREFGLLLSFTFTFLIGWILPSIGGHPFRTWTIWISLPLLILAILKPSLLTIPYRYWIMLGNILGYINSHIVLGLVFLMVVQPIAIIMRILGHDPLRLKKTDQKSYREIKSAKKVNLKKIF